MARLLLMLFLVGVASYAMGESTPTLTAYEIWWELKNESNGWLGLTSGDSHNLNIKGLNVSVPASVRVNALAAWGTAFCPNVIAIGIGMCQDWGVYGDYVAFSWNFKLGLKASSWCSQSKWHAGRKSNTVSSTTNLAASGGISACGSRDNAVARALLELSQDSQSNFRTRTNNWQISASNYQEGGPYGYTGPSREEFNAAIIEWIAKGLLLLIEDADNREVYTIDGDDWLFVGVDAWLEMGVTITGDYVDGGWCEDGTVCDGESEPGTPAPGDGGGDGDGSGGDAGGGGTDWQEGKHKTRCDGVEGLNIFEKALFFAFEPCQPWADRFRQATEVNKTRFPFGLSGWFSFQFAYQGQDGGPSGLGIPTTSIANVTEMGDGYYRPAMAFVLPEVQIGPITVPPYVLRFDEIAAFQWWHKHGRTWLWWSFLALFWYGVFRRVIA
jgi:hypothetical protein